MHYPSRSPSIGQFTGIRPVSAPKLLVCLSSWLPKFLAGQDRYLSEVCNLSTKILVEFKVWAYEFKGFELINNKPEQLKLLSHSCHSASPRCWIYHECHYEIVTKLCLFPIRPRFASFQSWELCILGHTHPNFVPLGMRSQLTQTSWSLLLNCPLLVALYDRIELIAGIFCCSSPYPY